MSDRDSGYGSRLLDFCMGMLFSAMALYAAVQVIKGIWLALCIGAGLVVIVAAIAAAIHYRFRRW